MDCCDETNARSVVPHKAAQIEEVFRWIADLVGDIPSPSRVDVSLTLREIYFIVGSSDFAQWQNSIGAEIVPNRDLGMVEASRKSNDSWNIFVYADGGR